MQEEYIKEEQRNLKRELLRAQEEVRRIQSVPLVIGQFLEMVDNTSGIVGSTTGKAREWLLSPSRVTPLPPCLLNLSTCCRQQLLCSDSVHLEQGTAEAQLQRGAAQALQCACGHPAA